LHNVGGLVALAAILRASLCAVCCCVVLAALIGLTLFSALPGLQHYAGGSPASTTASPCWRYCRCCVGRPHEPKPTWGWGCRPAQLRQRHTDCASIRWAARCRAAL